MDNSRSFLFISIVFNVLSLGALLVHFYSPRRTSTAVCKVGIISPSVTPGIARIQEGIKENLSPKNYKLSVYEIQEADNKESIAAAIDKAVQDGSRLLIPIGRNATLAAYDATKKNKIPIVFCEVQDPVIDHLVDTPQISGNHVTGVVRVPADYTKFLDGISVLQPAPHKIVLIHMQPTSEENKEAEDFIDACKVKALDARSVALKESSHMIKSIYEIVATKPDAIMILTEGFSDAQIKEAAQIGKKNHILVFCNNVKYARDNMAISFGVNDYNIGKTVAQTVDTIIKKGIPPTKIPLHSLDTAFSFSVNTKLLKEQGVTIRPDHLFIIQYGQIIT